MTRIFVAPGHGRAPSGTWDPGAVSGRYVEHSLNTAVADALARALERCGIDVVLEQGGGNHDPNYIGSTRAANASGADYAVEVHHNAGGGTGCEVLVNDATGAANKALAERMTAGMAKALGIPARRVIARDREYFNRETQMPSCIPECCFVDSKTDQAVIDTPGYAARAAEPIAKALCGFLHVTYRPPSQPAPQPAPATDEEDDMTKEEFKQAWKEITAQGIIAGQDDWADYFRVMPDRGAKIIEAQQATNEKVDALLAGQQATNDLLGRIATALEAQQPPTP